MKESGAPSCVGSSIRVKQLLGIRIPSADLEPLNVSRPDRVIDKTLSITCCWSDELHDAVACIDGGIAQSLGYSGPHTAADFALIDVCGILRLQELLQHPAVEHPGPWR